MIPARSDVSASYLKEKSHEDKRGYRQRAGVVGIWLGINHPRYL